MSKHSVNRKHGRLGRKPCNLHQEARTARNRTQRLKRALQRNPSCTNTRQALKKQGRGDIVQLIDKG